MNMPNFKRAWQHTPSVIRKPLVVIIAVPILAAGVLMLFLPGPGWAAIFLAFAILATEFAFAARARDAAIALIKRGLRFLKQLWRRHRRTPEDAKAPAKHKRQ